MAKKLPPPVDVHQTLRKSHKTVPDHPFHRRNRPPGLKNPAQGHPVKKGGSQHFSPQSRRHSTWLRTAAHEKDLDTKKKKKNPDVDVLSSPSVELSSEPRSARAPQPEPASTMGTLCCGCPPSLGQHSPPTCQLWGSSGPMVTALGQKFNSVAQSCLTFCDPMDCMQHARPPCQSPTPGVHSDSCPSRQ